MKKFWTSLSFIVFSLSLFAQENKQNTGNRLETIKIGFITKKLDLTTEEAQRFWPIYNNYSKEIRDARFNQHKNKGNVLEDEENILSIRKKYNTEFEKAINADKVNTFFKSEKEFNNYVQRELRQRKQIRTPEKSKK